MNRNQEYLALMEELEKNVPDLKGSVKKARNRRFRHRFIFRPAAVLAVSFLLFVAAVNFSPAVAYACSLVPGLRELAAAVSFSRSLSDAVDNDYVQEVNLTQTRNDITVQIPYLIVDQKQVNVFYTLSSDRYKELDAWPTNLTIDGNPPDDCSICNNSLYANDGLRSFTIEFGDTDVPKNLEFQMGVYQVWEAEKLTETEEGTEEFTETEEEEDDLLTDNYDMYEDWYTDSESEEEEDLTSTEEEADHMAYYLDCFEQSCTEFENEDDDDAEEDDDDDIDCLALLDFHLEIDPDLRTNGKILPVDCCLDLNGQKITVRQLEVYPTHCRVNLEEDPDNTAWLKSLDFNIATTFWGKRFEATGTAFGAKNSNSVLSYHADSPYFYKARHIKLVITGAEWEPKDQKKSRVNLQTGETRDLPPGVTFKTARKIVNGSGWIAAFLWTPPWTGLDNAVQSDPFNLEFYDMDGNEYDIYGPCSWNWSDPPDEKSNYTDLIIYYFPHYPYDEVLLSPNTHDSWTPEKEIIVKIQ